MFDRSGRLVTKSDQNMPPRDGGSTPSVRRGRKVEPDPARPTHILTAHGRGYRWAGG